MMKLLILALTVALASAFVANKPRSAKGTSQLFISKKAIQMIEEQWYRQQHMEEIRAKEAQQVATYVDKPLPQGYNDNFIAKGFEERARIMAREYPDIYCKHKCLSSGNCEAFEDAFHMDSLQAMQFCKDCVLSDGEEPCDVPEQMLDEGFQNLAP